MSDSASQHGVDSYAIEVILAGVAHDAALEVVCAKSVAVLAHCNLYCCCHFGSRCALDPETRNEQKYTPFTLTYSVGGLLDPFVISFVYEYLVAQF